MGLWNPPCEHLPELCRRMSEYWLRVAALLPRLVVEALRAEAAGAGEAHRELGHLRGWGRGLDQGGDNPMFRRSAGNDCRRTLRWLVRGSGSVTLRVGNARVGWVEETVHVGE